MTITITVNNIWSKISNVDDPILIDKLDRELSFYVQGYQYTKAYKQGFFKNGVFSQWDGKRHLLTRQMVFPTGLLNRVIDFFKNKKVCCIVNDKRPEIQYGKPLEIKNVEPRYYQKEALQAIINSGTGIIKSATGSGKTLIAAMIAGYYNVPCVIYTIGKSLLYQFYNSFKEFFGSEVEIGIIGDGNCIIKKN